ncbi:MAG TPA: CAP domain-containing protein [Actinomycetota bacterium]
MLSLAHPRIKRIPILMLLATLLLSLVAHGEAEAAPKAQRVERRLMNQERRPKARATFRLDHGLSRIARRHSRRMARTGTLHHNPNLVDQVQGRRWQRLGENVGVVGPTGDLRETLRLLHGAFMNSDAHRRNILYRPFRRVGVGLVRDDGLVWVTVVFLG